MSKTTEIPTMGLGEGDSAVMSHTLINRIPVNYSPGTEIMYGEHMLYTTGKTVRDADMKVFLCILKAYTDNKHDTLVKAKKRPTVEISLDSIIFNVSVAEISTLAYKQRARGKRLVQSLERLAEMKIHLLDDKGDMMGFVQLVGGSKLSKDRKTLEVAMNKSFLKDMAKTLVQYNFPKMLELKNLDFRLYIAMQQRKYMFKNGRYAYTNIDHDELLAVLNTNPKNAKSKIKKAFQSIGIDFVLGTNNKWHYPKVKTVKNTEL